MSSTSSTRRQPAIAFCASLSTSVAICTGWTNSVTRNRNAVSSPTVSVAVDAEQHADHDHRGQRQPGRQLAGGEADMTLVRMRPLLGPPVARRSPSSSRRAVRPATPYARMTSAPTTLSPTAPSMRADPLRGPSP